MHSPRVLFQYTLSATRIGASSFFGHEPERLYGLLNMIRDQRFFRSLQGCVFLQDRGSPCLGSGIQAFRHPGIGYPTSPVSFTDLNSGTRTPFRKARRTEGSSADRRDGQTDHSLASGDATSKNRDTVPAQLASRRRPKTDNYTISRQILHNLRGSEICTLASQNGT